MAYLEMQRDSRTHDYELGAVTTLGRSAECKIVIPSVKASRSHCKITQVNSDFVVTDVGSCNGTFVNNERVLRAVLRDRDLISIGGIVLKFFTQSGDPLLNKKFADYMVLEKIGSGGMGVVYRATQISLDRPVALKMLSSKVTDRENSLAAFESEARIAAQLSHPNIVAIYEFGKFEQWNFLAMEYVDGENLLDEILRKGTIGIPEMLNYASQLANALIYTHRAGVIHRDIKPRNVLIKPTGIVKLADMGLASLINVEENAESAAAPAQPLLATPQYVAPEIIRRSPPSRQCDIYSYCATLYHGLTGSPPYDADKISELLKMHLYAPVPDPRRRNPRISEALAAIIMRGLSKNPSDRQHSFEELSAELEVLQNDEIEQQRRISNVLEIIGKENVGITTSKMSTRSSRSRLTNFFLRHRKLVIPIAILAGVLLVVGVVAIWKYREIKRQLYRVRHTSIIVESSPQTQRAATINPPKPTAVPATGGERKLSLSEPTDNSLVQTVFEKSKLQQRAGTEMIHADGLYAAGQFAESLAIYAQVYEGLRNDPAGELAAVRMARIMRTISDILSDGWRDFAGRLQENDYLGALVVAQEVAANAKNFPFIDDRVGWVKIAENTHEFVNAAIAALTADMPERNYVRVLVDGRARRAQIEARGDRLFAIGRNNEKEISIADVNLDDLLAIMPVTDSETLAAGALAYFTIHDKGSAAQPKILAAVTENSPAYLAMRLKSFNDGRAPLWSFNDLYLSDNDQNIATVVAPQSLNFLQAGEIKSFAAAWPIRNLSLIAQFTPTAGISLWANRKNSIALTRRGEQITITWQKNGEQQSFEFTATPSKPLAFNFNSGALTVTDAFSNDEVYYRLPLPGAEEWVVNLLFKADTAGAAITNFLVALGR